MNKASGNFVLRMDPALHGRLRRAARKAGVSLNEHCVRVLAGHEAALRSWVRRSLPWRFSVRTPAARPARGLMWTCCSLSTVRCL